MNRRSFATLFIASVLAGCNSGTGVPTLDQVKEWATNIINGLSTEAEAFINAGTITGTTATKVQSILNSLQAELTLLNSTAGSIDVKQTAGLILQGVQNILPLIPLPPAISASIQLGLMVLVAYINSLPSAVPAVPDELQSKARAYHGGQLRIIHR